MRASLRLFSLAHDGRLSLHTGAGGIAIWYGSIGKQLARLLSWPVLPRLKAEDEKFPQLGSDVRYICKWTVKRKQPPHSRSMLNFTNCVKRGKIYFHSNISDPFFLNES